MKTFYTWGDSAIAEGVNGREHTSRLVSVDLESATKVAHAIRHPWYRCQALARVAESTLSTRMREALLQESLASAYELEDPNPVVSVAAWPLAQFATIDVVKAEVIVRALLTTIHGEPHGLRKLDGISRILYAVIKTKELRERVLPAFRAAASASTGWRTERIIAVAAEALAEFDSTAASALLSSRPSNRFTQRARARIDKRSTTCHKEASN